jgi:biotin transport system substrate-specific component
VREPGFGYLIGFVPAGWVCGYLAFQNPPKLETLALSCLSGLGIIHGLGIVYLTLASLLGWLQTVSASYWELLVGYTILPLPGPSSGSVCGGSAVAGAATAVVLLGP